MGNRATVIFTDGRGTFSPAVYLHWNGGPESVYGFLEELDRRNVRADQDYECARFIQVVADAFGEDGLSLGVVNGPVGDDSDSLNEVQTDHGDNGFYLVNRTGELSVRRFIERGSFDKGYRMVELEPGHAATERRMAERHEYREQFRAHFAALTEFRTKQDAV